MIISILVTFSIEIICIYRQILLKVTRVNRDIHGRYTQRHHGTWTHCYTSSTPPTIH